MTPPHGVANAIILPTVMEYNAEATGEKYREIARAMGVEGVDDMTQEEYRKAAIDAVKQLSADVGIPADLKDIVMSASVGAATERLREFLFDQVYWRPAALEEEEKVKQMIHFLCQYYQQFPQELPQGAKGDIAQRVCDYIAGMTDRFALEHYHALASEG